MLCNKINDLNKKLPLIFNESHGLAFGKIGLAIYFYQLMRLEDNVEYGKFAKKYLDEVSSKIDTIKEVDIKNGLSGIGLGINYLVKNGFISGNINNILGEIDDYLFKTLSVSKYNEQLDTLTMIQLLYYFYIRLQDQKQDSENDYFFKEICIKTINIIYSKMGKITFGTRLIYDVEQELPLFLYVLSEIYNRNFYNVRIRKIVNELSPTILSSIPILHSNRLYLLWVISTIYKQVKLIGWKEHIELLKRELNLDEIVNIELKNRNIFFNNGVTSIFLLSDSMKDILGEEAINTFQQKLFRKIEQSEVWNLLEVNPLLNMHTGLYDGFCGAVLLLITCNKNSL